MFRILTCLTTQHDWRLVVVAGAVCFLASVTAITLFNRRALNRRVRARRLARGGRSGDRLRNLGDSLPRDAGL